MRSNNRPRPPFSATLHRVVSAILPAIMLFGSGLPERMLADEVTFDDGHRLTTENVAELVRKHHFERQPIDNSVSIQLFDAYLESWDPNRLYFMASDIEEFDVYRKSLDDQIKAGQLHFAKIVYDRFMARNDVVQKVIAESIDRDHDFTIDEFFVVNGDKRSWARSVSEWHDEWRKMIKHQILTLTLEGKSPDEAKAVLRLRYATSDNLIRQTETDEVLERYLSCMLGCLDPHSRFFSRRTTEEFQASMALKITGIGARLRYEDGNTVVQEIIPGGAAEADGGLQPEDTIVAIGQGKDGQMMDIAGFRLERVVDQIRGKVGTWLRLRVRRTGDQSHMLMLRRQEIELKNQQVSGVILPAEEWLDGTEKTIGVLKIPSFYRDLDQTDPSAVFRSTARDTRVVLSQFRRQQVDAVVIDIRDNTGGALTEAVEVAGLFIPTGPVVQMVARDLKPRILADDSEEFAWTGPVVVLISRQTASASEVFAAAIKDYRRGLLIGDSSTHGKGSVQSILNIDGGGSGRNQGAVKLTVGAWHGVNGLSNQSVGVTSHIVIPSDTDLKTLGESSLNNVIATTSAEQLSFTPFESLLSDEVLRSVQTASEQRLAKDECFLRTQQRVDLMETREREDAISLNEVKRRRRKAVAEKLVTDVETSERGQTRNDGFVRNAYNTEVLRTTIDYLQRLETQAKDAN